MKAIVVFELPKKLEERYKLDEFSADVILTRETISMGEPYIVSFRIPQQEVVLRPSPKKRNPCEYPDTVSFEKAQYHASGYNQCLKDILGEAE